MGANLASKVACYGCERLPWNPVGPLLTPVRPRMQVKGRALGTADWRLSRPVRHNSSIQEPGADSSSDRRDPDKDRSLTCISAGPHLPQLVPHLLCRDGCKICH